MSIKEDVGSYPLKSLHDFLTELDREWDRFRTVSIIGIVTSGLLMFFLMIRFIRLIPLIKRVGLIPVLDELVFLIFIAVFVIYEISLLFGQYKFFKRWERRIGLLLHLEERLMESSDN